MGLFGYKGCNERRNDCIELCRKNAEGILTVAEQLSSKEAEECYKELKEMILDKKTHIEIENTDGDLFFIRKDEIGKVQWVKDN